MKTIARFFALAVLLGAAACSKREEGPVRSGYSDVINGFSLDGPRFPGSDGKKAVVAVSIAGPYANGFASNVNVTIQPVITSLEKFKALTLTQLEHSNLKVNAQRTLKVSGRDALEIDYEGTLEVMNNTRKLRFLVLSVIDKDRVLALTCTALPEEFAAAEAEFRSCLASFRVK